MVLSLSNCFDQDFMEKTGKQSFQFLWLLFWFIKTYYLVRKRFRTKVVKITLQASFLENKVDIFHLIHHLILCVNSTKLLQTYKYSFGGDIGSQRKGFHFQINKSSSFVTFKMEAFSLTVNISANSWSNLTTRRWNPQEKLIPNIEILTVKEKASIFGLNTFLSSGVTSSFHFATFKLFSLF